MKVKNTIIPYEARILESIVDEEVQRTTFALEKGSSKFILNYPYEFLLLNQFIDYANDEANWDDEDLTLFQKNLVNSRINFEAFEAFFRTNGYNFLSPSELGTLWVIAQAMSQRLMVIGLPDEFNKRAKNTWTAFIRSEESKEQKKANREAEIKKPGSLGPKKNVYHTAHQAWMMRLLPLLQNLAGFRTRKRCLLLIGLLLDWAGHYEFREQYDRNWNIREELTKKGEILLVTVSFEEYLYQRIKAIYFQTPLPET